ncbi:MAG: fibronectin type III domain-containing protein, partial [Candidatus Vogelbacteria bacterium]
MKYINNVSFRAITSALIVFILGSFVGSSIGSKIINSTTNRSQLAVITNPVGPLSNFSTFGMQILSATSTGGVITVTTTGAQYILTSTGMEMWRRIDPHTNTVNPRKVATLTFNSNLGPLTIENTDNSHTLVQSTLATFEFMSDSLFFITAKSPFTYTHTNLIANAPWNKGAGRDRMWTDGYGGSLHAQVAGGTTATNNLDSTTISLVADDVMAHMVYPPKLFDYEGFYGATAKPFVTHAFSESEISALIADINTYAQNNFGVIELFATFYTNDYRPTLVSPNVMGYTFRNEALIRQLVATAHANGFKVTAYLSYPSGGPSSFLQGGPEWVYPAEHPRAGQHQDISTTLEWMKNFQAEFNLDGWYFDNADAGGFLDDYNFIRQVRTDIGDDGIIYHHDSVDVWGGWSGLRAVMVDAYVNYILAGETGREPPNLTAKIQDPNDPYLRFYSSGYGLSQAHGSHIRLSNMKLALSEGELARTVMENFVGMINYGAFGPFWLNNIKPPYDAKKAAYLAGALPPDIDWPVNPNTGWFREVQDARVTYNATPSATLTWQTNEPSTSEVAWSSNGFWWYTWDTNLPDGPDGRKTDNALVINHNVNITGLTAGMSYEFRIRSCSPSACETSPFNPATNDILTGKTVWGTVVPSAPFPNPDTTPPSVPANLTPTPVSVSQINLHWSNSIDPIVTGQTTSGLAGYRL